MVFPGQHHHHIAACLLPVPAGLDEENSNGRSHEFKNLNTIKLSSSTTTIKKFNEKKMKEIQLKKDKQCK